MTQLFTQETGAILSPTRDILHLVDGTFGLTIFPQEILWSLHKLNPGCIYALSHVHPPGMVELSHEDETTLLAQALAVYPFPSRMITISECGGHFHEVTYFLKLEPKEDWLIHKGKRKWEIIEEFDTIHTDYEDEPEWYGWALVERSYFNEEEIKKEFVN